MTSSTSSTGRPGFVAPTVNVDAPVEPLLAGPNDSPHGSPVAKVAAQIESVNLLCVTPRKARNYGANLNTVDGLPGGLPPSPRLTGRSRSAANLNQMLAAPRAAPVNLQRTNSTIEEQREALRLADEREAAYTTSASALHTPTAGQRVKSAVGGALARRVPIAAINASLRKKDVEACRSVQDLMKPGNEQLCQNFLSFLQLEHSENFAFLIHSTALLNASTLDEKTQIFMTFLRAPVKELNAQPDLQVRISAHYVHLCEAIVAKESPDIVNNSLDILSGSLKELNTSLAKGLDDDPLPRFRKERGL